MWQETEAPCQRPCEHIILEEDFQSQLDLQLTADPANVLKLQPPQDPKPEPARLFLNSLTTEVI